MANNPKYITTAEACARVGTYNAYLWSLIGRKLTAPRRVGSKKVYWLAEEIDALALELRELRQAIQ